MNPTVDTGAAAAATLLSGGVAVVLYVWLSLALSAMFRKMGEETWRAWVPLLNIATLLRWAGFSPWLVLLFLIPVAGQFAGFVLLIIAAHRLGPGFGYGGAMTVVAALLFPVWATIVGFGPARWLGARPARAVRTPPPAAAATPVAPARDVSPGAVSDDVADLFRGTDTGETDRSTAADAHENPFALSSRHDEPALAGDRAPAASTEAADATRHTTPPADLPSTQPFDFRAMEPARGEPSPWAPPVQPAASPVQPAAPAAPPVASRGPASAPAPAPAPSLRRNAADESASQRRPAAAEPASAAADADRDDAWPSDDRQRLTGWEPLRDESAESAAAAGASGVRRGSAAAGRPVDDQRWPSEVDEVSAVSPAPFPPNAASAGRRGGPAFAEDDLISAVPSSHDAGRDADRDAERDAPVDRARPAYDPEAFPEMSGEVSAIIGAPIAGSPRAARSSVSSQQHEAGEAAASEAPSTRARSSKATPAPEPAPPADRAAPEATLRRAPAPVAPTPEAPADDLDDDFDQTVIVRRRRAAWQLTPHGGSPIPLTGDVVILGRKPAPDAAHPRAQLVPLDDATRTVSKTHARLEMRGDEWHIIDLHSTNGVLLPTYLGAAIEVDPGEAVLAGERFLLGDAEFRLSRAED